MQDHFLQGQDSLDSDTQEFKQTEIVIIYCSSSDSFL
jgi:hypothetical protein